MRSSEAGGGGGSRALETYLTPFNFRPPLIFGRGGRKLEGPKKSSLFLGGRKLKGPKFFQNPSITLKQKRKKSFKEGGRK